MRHSARQVLLGAIQGPASPYQGASVELRSAHQAFRERVSDPGIAEQNPPTFAVVLTPAGKTPFYKALAMFAVHQRFDMI